MDVRLEDDRDIDRRRRRRSFLRRAMWTGTGAMWPMALSSAERPGGGARPDQVAEEVSPPEDLMREHGVLKRVLLIYDEAGRRIAAKQDLSPDAVHGAASIIRSFIEDYHEKLEEDFLFPRFERANRLTDLTTVLRAQHQAGRRLTDRILQLATASRMKDPASVTALTRALQEFTRMYNPHEAREDTVLFPALRQIVSKNEFASLGEDFEKKEHALFGADGFERTVDRVAALEKTLGIYDLQQFTPRSSP
jgi:hemerythrin-like domain-containing protein